MQLYEFEAQIHEILKKSRNRSFAFDKIDGLDQAESLGDDYVEFYIKEQKELALELRGGYMSKIHLE